MLNTGSLSYLRAAVRRSKHHFQGDPRPCSCRSRRPPGHALLVGIFRFTVCSVGTVLANDLRTRSVFLVLRSIYIYLPSCMLAAAKLSFLGCCCSALGTSRSHRLSRPTSCFPGHFSWPVFRVRGLSAEFIPFFVRVLCSIFFPQHLFMYLRRVPSTLRNTYYSGCMLVRPRRPFFFALHALLLRFWYVLFWSMFLLLLLLFCYVVALRLCMMPAGSRCPPPPHTSARLQTNCISALPVALDDGIFFCLGLFRRLIFVPVVPRVFLVSGSGSSL